MENILHKHIACPSCGDNKFNPEKQCICGYNADESFITEALVMKSRSANHEGSKVKELKNDVNSKSKKSAEEIAVKEIDSWFFTFSQVDNCITLGTPALQSFRLKLTVEDLEELLEFVYRNTGEEKTTRKLQLSAEALPDLIAKVHKLIEDKKSKMPIKFDNNELQEITAMINMKLKE